MSNSEPKPLAVYVLADVSGSMAGAPLKRVQDALATIVKNLKTHALPVSMTLFTYGRTVTQAVPLTAVSSFTIPTLAAGGFTPLGEALARVGPLLTREPHALLLILSDGHVTDDFAKSARGTAKNVCPSVLACLALNALHPAPRGIRGTKVKLQRADAAENLYEWLASVIRAVHEGNDGASAWPALPDGVAPWPGDDTDIPEAMPASSTRALDAAIDADSIIIPLLPEEDTREATVIHAHLPSTRREPGSTQAANTLPSEFESRPYFNNSIEDLEAFAQTPDMSILNLLAEELNHRHTARAHDLKTAIQLKLNKRPPPATPTPAPLPARKRGGLFDHLVG